MKFIIITVLVLIIVKLYFSLKTIKKRCADLETLEAEPEIAVSQHNNEIDYFKSDRDRILFLLLEVDGKRRNQQLGITSEMYENPEVAKKWYKTLATKVHPDKNPNEPKAAEAFDKLKNLYSKITF
ncbi:DnaJ domain-containing protein [Aliivibrio sp. S2TY2]|uniref:DnaJ domain-containing protein n=1 Tax=unclassified Aliivibrio TaxID=2645654 RepID=UPI0023790553|nr:MULTISPECIES: DnaJ domain-containing protein [unclassified Aliivibrio]MDD9176050.1 DnaJ domain-containing protein [Aliivibrio sp. S3TY1]MDD9193036.1 DnaJ domain-containing protein [Aliivibrio sp. S2TY2]